MPQLSIYLDKDIHETVIAAAKREKKLLSSRPRVELAKENAKERQQDQAK